jgi:cell division protein FtsB
MLPRRQQVRRNEQMYPETEPRRGSFGGTLYVGFLAALIGYLTFAAFQGEHGLFSLLRVEAQEARLREELAALEAERVVIANKALRLSAGSLDLDLLDEQARKILGLGRPDEIIIR